MEIALTLLLSVGAGAIGGMMAMASPRVRGALPSWAWPTYWIALGLVLVFAGVSWVLGWR